MLGRRWNLLTNVDESAGRAAEAEVSLPQTLIPDGHDPVPLRPGIAEPGVQRVGVITLKSLDHP